MLTDERLAKIRLYMEQNGLDGYFVAKKENVRYISGYTGDDSWLLLTKSSCCLLTDPRYSEQASMECLGYEIVIWRRPGKTVADAVAELAVREQAVRIGFEPDRMNYQWYSEFTAKDSLKLVPCAGAIERLRAVKSRKEISCIRAACDISCRAFERLLNDIRVGVTEKELAAKLSLYMVQEGADTQPYGNMVISGMRTSLLHGIPSSRAIEYGDLVLMDFGCQYNGYLSDMTRTVVVGRGDSRQREIYSLERQMVESATTAMKPGATSREVYDASIAAIKGTEYEQYHYSSIGHGIGLFVHEPPFMGVNSQDRLEVGNTVTIEPGIYIPGWGGVRIEDQLLITEDGNENLIHISHELIEI